MEENKRIVCHKCHRVFSHSTCSDCGMTVKESIAYDEGYNACLRYIRNNLPSERKVRR